MPRTQTPVNPPATAALTLVAAFAAMLALRAGLVLQAGGADLSIWSPAADLAGALFVALAAPWLPTSRATRLALSLVVALAYFAAGEHLHTHASLFRLAHIGQAANPAFLEATLITPGLLFLPVYAALAYGALGLLRRLTPSRPWARGRYRAGAMLAILAAYYLAVPTPTLPANNVVLSALVQLPGAGWRSLPLEAEPDLVADDRAGDPAFFLREDAQRTASDRPNLLLILIEGLSGAYLPTLAEYHGLTPGIALPELEDTLERHRFRVYRNPLNLQRQTNRGTYPILCGDYPKIVTAVPKMTVATGHDQPLNCLPRLLREAGYATAYIQAAPLSFMSKNEFMPQAGFKRVIGRGTFIERDIPAQGWGPGDADFLAFAGEELSRLRTGDKPWFATLLNVGTHHPYRQGANGEVRAARQQSFRTMSRAFADFMSGLAADGLLRDTWVVLASDEAGGFRERPDNGPALANNFGMLAVRPPDLDAEPVLADRDRIVTQTDIPITLLDVAGLSDRGNMVGRSLLADSATQRRGILFGDTYRARSYFLYEDGHLLDCDETLVRCRHWRFQPTRLFGSLRETTEDAMRLTFEDRAELAADASVIRDLGVATAHSYRLAPGQISAQRPYRGGQNLAVRRGDKLHVTLVGQAVAADGRADVGELKVILRDARDGDTIAQRRLWLDGNTLKLELTITVEQARADANVALNWSPSRRGDSLALQELRLDLERPAGD